MQQYAKELDEHQNRTTDPEMLRKWTDRIIEKQSERGKYLNLCYSDGTAAGFFFGRTDLPGDKGFTKEGWGCIVEFYVVPKCRGKGCGREMFLHLQAMFRKDGAKKMYLTADPVTGKPFWEAMGFIRTGEISPENGQQIYQKAIPDEAISFSVREFIDLETARKIAQAQWNAPNSTTVSYILHSAERLKPTASMSSHRTRLAMWWEDYSACKTARTKACGITATCSLFQNTAAGILQ